MVKTIMNWEEKWCKLNDTYSKRRKKIDNLILKYGDEKDLKHIEENWIYQDKQSKKHTIHDMLRKRFKADNWLKTHLSEKEYEQFKKWNELNGRVRYNISLLDEKYNK